MFAAFRRSELDRVHHVLHLFVVSRARVFYRRRPLKRRPAARKQMPLDVRRFSEKFPAFGTGVTSLTLDGGLHPLLELGHERVGLFGRQRHISFALLFSLNLLFDEVRFDA